MEKELFNLDVDAMYFLVCFNKTCPQCGNCLRYAVGAEASKTRSYGLTVYPSAVNNEQCKFFRSTEKVKLAWGMNRLRGNVPIHLRSMVRRRITHYLGSVGTFYRYNDGTRKLSPKQQKDIERILAGIGYPMERPFDHYIESYDIT